MQTPRRGERNFCVLSEAKDGRSPPAGRKSVISTPPTWYTEAKFSGNSTHSPHSRDLLAQIWSKSAQILSNLAQFGQPKSAFKVMNRGESRVPDCAKLVQNLHYNSANLL
ncbi:MAG: hypothetical protein KME55_25150 [Nostoc indistinguendum CM1-VF10]|nr:hypothetical protein [Nostoc indistinguendum CM1-VF10]